MLTHSPRYFINYRLFLDRLNEPERPAYQVARAVRMKAVTRGTQSRLGRIRAEKVFDRIMGKGEV